jgi:hypothetical protein
MCTGVKDVDVPSKTCVSIDEWVDVWGVLVGKAKKMDDFPMWLQYYPKVLFDVINRSGELKKLRLQFNFSFLPTYICIKAFFRQSVSKLQFRNLNRYGNIFAKRIGEKR